MSVFVDVGGGAHGAYPVRLTLRCQPDKIVRSRRRDHKRGSVHAVMPRLPRVLAYLSMMVSVDVATRRLRDALEVRDDLVRAVGTGRIKGTEPRWRRVELRYVELNRGKHLQVTTYDASRARARNAPASSEDAMNLIEEALAAGFRNWHVDTRHGTLEVRITKRLKGSITFRQRDTEPDSGSHQSVEHDRSIKRQLPANHPVLKAVGISDDKGRVKPTKQSKYRQVDEFLKLMWASLEQRIPAASLSERDRPIDIVDLGCGSAYLTFCAVAFLRDVQGIDARVTGVDVRDEVRTRNQAIAESLGLANCVGFASGSIAEFSPKHGPDVVLSLHACDTATDEALAQAIHWDSAVVLAAPCCHHDIQSQLRTSRSVRDWKSEIIRDGVLAERLGDVLTDSARVSLLRLNGYRVDVVQFVDPENTARNILIRAILDRGYARGNYARQLACYNALVDDWAITPALGRMLKGNRPVLDKDT